jgi:signal transduction histidine kinase
MITLLGRGSDSRDHRRGVLAGRLTTEEVLAIMVHDLRSPLAAIQMALEVVRLAHAEHSEVERAFGVMERQVGDLARLIGDLLDLTRVTKGKVKLRPEWVDLSAVIDHAVEACHPLIAQKHHQLRYHCRRNRPVCARTALGCSRC